MSRVRVFQSLVLTSLIVYAAWWFLPLVPREQPAEVLQLLTMSGYGSSPIVQQAAFYVPLTAAKVVATLGLILFLQWSRWLFVLVLAMSLAAAPFSGVSVVPALDGAIGTVNTVLDGIIVGVMFSSPIADHWRNDG